MKKIKKCVAKVRVLRRIVSTFAFAHYQVFFKNLQRLLGRAKYGSLREHFFNKNAFFLAFVILTQFLFFFIIYKHSPQ